ncbi:NADH-quinone oxidoreductase subunit J [Dehalococcoidia bacterium]|nr:NADH-quinone oxidoreductase subunit J [Dehalococcoidia bacterium]
MSPLVAIYIVLSVSAIGGGAGVVLSRNVVYASLCLLLSLLSVAGIYILIFSPFLALVQVLIYGGAITVVVLFALMLTRQREQPSSLDNPNKLLAGIVGLATMGLLITTVVVSRWPDDAEPGIVGFRDLGTTLFTQWAVPFEIASLLLLVALIGAIVIARPGGRE